MTNVKVRFAPSPTGKLHVGNVRTALVNFLYARAAGGQFMLRIDDTDDERSTAAFERAIRADLSWLGLAWDCEDRQSSRLERYTQALQTLVASGRAYTCYETQDELGLKRKSQLMAGRPPVYDRSSLSLTAEQIAAYEAEGRRPHYRFRLQDVEVAWTDLVRGPASYHMSSLSDPVLLREDGRVIYTLASVVDDIDHGITTVLRGEDHVTNSAAQIQLFEALGATAPQMGHLALLSGADGEGLSKRLGSLSIEQLRDEGFEPLALCSLLAKIGTSDPIAAFGSLDDIIASFQISKFGRSTARFSPDELSQINARILQTFDYAAVKERLDAAGLGDIDEGFWAVVRGNISSVGEAGKWWNICTQPVTPLKEDAEVMAAAIELLPDGEINAESWGVLTKAISAQTGKKGRALFMPLRQAITGESAGPDMAALLPYIGRDRVLARLAGNQA